MRIGPPDYPGIHMSAGENRRSARWTDSTDPGEFEGRVFRLAVELTAIARFIVLIPALLGFFGLGLGFHQAAFFEAVSNRITGIQPLRCP